MPKRHHGPSGHGPSGHSSPAAAAGGGDSLEHTIMSGILSITTGTQMSDLVRDEGGAVVDRRAMLVAFKGLPFVLRPTLLTPNP